MFLSYIGIGSGDSPGQSNDGDEKRISFSPTLVLLTRLLNSPKPDDQVTELLATSTQAADRCSTPPGIGWAKEPRRMLKHGDEFRVHVSHGVGTLINGIEFEK